MTRDEFMLFAAALRTYYPREQIFQSEQSLELWFDMLNDIPIETAQTVLKAWVATQKWSPTIAELREQCAELTKGKRPDWGDAWENVMRLIRRYGYMREDRILAELDDTTREVVVIMGLQELAATETADNAFRRREFAELYNSRMGHRKTLDQLPASVIESEKRLHERGDEYQRAGMIGGKAQ